MPIAQKHDAAFLLNDRPEYGGTLGCDGVHVRPTGCDLQEARAAVGCDRIVGSPATTPATSPSQRAKRARIMLRSDRSSDHDKGSAIHARHELLEWWAKIHEPFRWSPSAASPSKTAAR